MKLTMIVGLPGSGKFDLAKELWFKDRNALVINEPRTRAELTWSGAEGRDLIIADSLLCDPSVRIDCKRLIPELWPELDPKADVTWIFFDSMPLACINNLKMRCEKKEYDQQLELLERLKRGYIIPLIYRDRRRVRTAMERVIFNRQTMHDWHKHEHEAVMPPNFLH